jgi:hypothetical protein
LKGNKINSGEQTLMPARHQLFGMLTVLAGTILATLCFVACNQTQQPTTKGTAAPADVTTAAKVYVQFEGPWAFVPDPQDPNGTVLAIAPKTADHHDLFVKASNDITLPTAGVYGLSLPAQSSAAAATDPAFVHFDIPASNVQTALAASGTRYAMRIPKPQSYIVVGRSQSRYGTSYPPTTNQGDHATAVALAYVVPSISGISVNGTADSGTFNPFVLQVDIPFIRVVIEPSQLDDPADACDTHSRAAFNELTTLLGIGLYVDFPGYTAQCQGSDMQQKSRLKKKSAIPTTLIDRIAALSDSDSNTGPLQPQLGGAATLMLNLSDESSRARFNMLSYLLFFGRSGADCKAPVIIGSGS